MMEQRKPLVCLVSCYYDVNYVRTTTIKDALSKGPYDFVHVANRSRNLKRYIEVLAGLIKTRLTKRPDIYFLTFRGYEILPIVRLITLGKPLIFDEFINPLELVVHEQKIIKSPFVAKILRWGYRLWLNFVQAVTTDTASHADYSAELMNLSRDRYTVLPVSTDELTFDADKYSENIEKSQQFQVFYYGSMLPLHGVDVVLNAMEILKDYKDIELLMVGGKKKAQQKIRSATQAGANIHHQDWIDYDKLPLAMKRADICLGGPFGATVQSQFVITGKTYQQLSMARPTIIGMNHESAVFTDKVNALVVEQNNSEKLAESILWANQNRDKLGQIGQNGRKLYQDEFSIDSLTGRIENLLARFVKDR